MTVATTCRIVLSYHLAGSRLGYRRYFATTAHRGQPTRRWPDAGASILECLIRSTPWLGDNFASRLIFRYSTITLNHRGTEGGLHKVPGERGGVR